MHSVCETPEELCHEVGGSGADDSPNLRPANQVSQANLPGTNLGGANLTYACLKGANLDDVILADFSGALNVPEKYRKN